jgi:hypothetical protein
MKRLPRKLTALLSVSTIALFGGSLAVDASASSVHTWSCTYDATGQDTEYGWPSGTDMTELTGTADCSESSSSSSSSYVAAITFQDAGRSLSCGMDGYSGSFWGPWVSITPPAGSRGTAVATDISGLMRSGIGYGNPWPGTSFRGQVDGYMTANLGSDDVGGAASAGCPQADHKPATGAIRIQGRILFHT